MLAIATALIALLPVQQESALTEPLPVADPAVRITHRVELDEVGLPLHWAQTEKWVQTGPEERAPDRRTVPAKKVRTEVIAMSPEAYAGAIASLPALEEPEIGSVPQDNRLLLSWSSSTTQVLISPAYFRNPPSAPALQDFYDHCVLAREIDHGAARTPKPPGEPQPPALTTWYVGVYSEGVETLHTTSAVHTQGQLVLPEEGAAAFSCNESGQGASVLVIAESVNSDDHWFWFEDLP